MGSLVQLGNHAQFRNGSTFGKNVFLNTTAFFSIRIPANSTYNGSLIRVRRSSDNMEQDIGPSLEVDSFGNRWLDTTSLLDFVGASSAFVVTWYDHSPNNNNATQTFASNQPRIVNAGVLDTLNGIPSIYYAGSGQTMTTTRLLSVFQNSIVNYVGSSARNSASPYSLNGSDSISRYSLHAPESGFFYADIGGLVPPSRLGAAFPYSFGAAHVFTSVNTNVRQLRGNGNILNTGTVASGNVSQGTAQIGATLYPGQYLFSGYLSEFVVFNQFVSQIDIQTLEQSQLSAFSI